MMTCVTVTFSLYFSVCVLQVVSSYCTVHSDDDVCNGDILSVFQCLYVTGGVVLLHGTQ